MSANGGRIAEFPQVTGGRGTSPDPLTQATVSLNIASHREELLRLNPGAVELAAACIFAFHAAINGSLTTALRSRSDSYAREQGTGKRALTVEDLCELVTAGGSEGRSAVRALLAPIIARLDEAGIGTAVNEAAADFAREAADVPSALLLGKGDSELRREIREAKERLRVLEAAVEARERVTARLAAVCGGQQ